MLLTCRNSYRGHPLANHTLTQATRPSCPGVDTEGSRKGRFEDRDPDLPDEALQQVVLPDRVIASAICSMHLSTMILFLLIFYCLFGCSGLSWKQRSSKQHPVVCKSRIHGLPDSPASPSPSVQKSSKTSTTPSHKAKHRTTPSPHRPGTSPGVAATVKLRLTERNPQFRAKAPQPSATSGASGESSGHKKVGSSAKNALTLSGPSSAKLSSNKHSSSKASSFKRPPINKLSPVKPLSTKAVPTKPSNSGAKQKTPRLLGSDHQPRAASAANCPIITPTYPTHAKLSHKPKSAPAAIPKKIISHINKAPRHTTNTISPRIINLAEPKSILGRSEGATTGTETRRRRSSAAGALAHRIVGKFSSHSVSQTHPSSA